MPFLERGEKHGPVGYPKFDIFRTGIVNDPYRTSLAHAAPHNAVITHGDVFIPQYGIDPAEFEAHLFGPCLTFSFLKGPDGLGKFDKGREQFLSQAFRYSHRHPPSRLGIGNDHIRDGTFIVVHQFQAKLSPNLKDLLAPVNRPHITEIDALEYIGHHRFFPESPCFNSPGRAYGHLPAVVFPLDDTV